MCVCVRAFMHACVCVRVCVCVRESNEIPPTDGGMHMCLSAHGARVQGYYLVETRTSQSNDVRRLCANYSMRLNSFDFLFVGEQEQPQPRHPRAFL